MNSNRKLDPHVVLLADGASRFVFHAATGEVIVLSAAGAAALESLGSADPASCFGERLRLPEERRQLEFDRVCARLAARGVLLLEH